MVKRFLFPAVLLVLIVAKTPSAQQTNWLRYEPNVVELRGQLVRVMKFGPPNYGENPQSDAKYYIPILVLPTPIRVAADQASSINRHALTNVTFVQLLLQGEDLAQYPKFGNQPIAVTGTLFRAHTGHHYTDLLMNVKKMRIAPKDIK